MKSGYIFKMEEENFEMQDINERDILLMNIERAKEAMEIAYAKFNLVSEPELVDCYIYELKASQLKYQYLVQQAKDLGIITNSI